MTPKTLPPQAYTRETLAKAYDWLKTQPLHIREQAQTVEALVGLFLHAKKKGLTPFAVLEGEGPTEPSLASVQSFKDDLKSVAKGLQQFDGPDGNEDVSTGFSFRSELTNEIPAPMQGRRLSEDLPFHPTPMEPAPMIHAAPQNLPHNVISSTFKEAQSITELLDERSRSALQQTKERLNLGSDKEALRVLVAIGFEKLRDSLPRGF